MRRGRRLALVAALAALIAGFGALPASAQTDTTTWAVRPAPTADEPARDAFRFDLSPGAVIHDAFRVRLQSQSPTAFDVYATDAVLLANGTLDLLPRTRTARDIGSWVTVDTPHITLAGGESVDVPFTIAVPANASPGDHVGGIVASLSTPGSDGSTVVIDRRIGSRIYARVSGATRSALTITKLRSTFEGGRITPGRVRTSFVVTNTGNVRVHAQALTTVTGLFSRAHAPVKVVPELLPGSSLRVETVTGSVKPTGRLKVRVRLVERAAARGEEPAVTFLGSEATTHVSAWPVPWLIGLTLVVLLGAGLRVARRRPSNTNAAVA
ncbi:MAG TPA: hypothetical protein VHC63_12115 [Acidimicrobiales bacterium]|nr:hypothetical protein [Acidimicrobiales bacterium]